MRQCKRFIPKCSATSAGGFTAVELLMGVVLMGIAVAATSGMFLASKQQMFMQQWQLEATQAARAAVDSIVRDLRLSGACLPTTGDFISLSGVNNGTTDQITTRTGLTQPNLSCVQAVVQIGSTVSASSSTVPVQSSVGFVAGMRAYIRNPTGTGEYFDITAVPSGTQLVKAQTLTQDYPETSGIYAIDERTYSLDTWTSPANGPQPELLLKVGNQTPQSFAIGIESLNIQYQLDRNCPSCDVVDLPTSNADWSLVEAVLLTITARSEQPDAEGNYYRRTVSVKVKPRNLLPP
jgi:Tfp pilus assembly protein PilW